MFYRHIKLHNILEVEKKEVKETRPGGTHLYLQLLGKLIQEDHHFKANPGNLVKLSPNTQKTWVIRSSLVERALAQHPGGGGLNLQCNKTKNRAVLSRELS